MSRRPYIEHYVCHVTHVTDWPKYAKVWMAWGSGGWRPGIVVGHRENRVGVRCTDGRWPFDGPRAQRLAFRSPNMLRARRGPERPDERSTGVPACLDMAAALRGLLPPEGVKPGAVVVSPPQESKT